MEDGNAIPIAIAIVRQDDSFLVGERRTGGPLAHYAEFPGGKCRYGESAEDCVVRECLEETGLRVVPLARRCEVLHEYPHGRLRLTFVDCVLAEEGVLTSSFRWVSRDDLARLKFPDANETVLRQLLAEKQSEPATLDGDRRLEE